MPVVQWVAHVLRATFWLAFNLAIVTGLFLLSAHLGTQPGEDERNAGLFVRGLASFWLYIAAWSWLVRGVFKRPAPPAQKGKPTGAAGRQGHPRVPGQPRAGALRVRVRRPFRRLGLGRHSWRRRPPSRPARLGSPARDCRSTRSNTPTRGSPGPCGCIVLYSVARAFMEAAATPAHVRRRQAQGANQAALQKLKRKAEADRQAGRHPGAAEILAAGR